MQTKYSGNISDYSKFVLLRELFSANCHNIGLMWYLYPDESHSNDGRFTDYLNNEAYAVIQPGREANQKFIETVHHQQYLWSRLG